MTARVARVGRGTWSLLFVVAFLALASVCGAQAAASTPAARALADSGLGEAIRTILLKSLGDGGRREGTVYTPADPATDSVLQAAGFPAVPIAGTQRPACPASTDKTGAPTAGSVGYIVQIHREQGPVPDVIQLDLTMSCFYIYYGGGRPFGEGWYLGIAPAEWSLEACAQPRPVGDVMMPCAVKLT